MSFQPDPKPRRRIRDPQLLRRMHIEKSGLPCEDCEAQRGVHLHHVKFRSQGGDDVRENLVWLCNSCHGKRHGL